MLYRNINILAIKSAFAIATVAVIAYHGTIVAKNVLHSRISKEPKSIVPATVQRPIASFAHLVDRNIFGISAAKFSDLSLAVQKKPDEKPSGEPSSLSLKGVITLAPGFAFIEGKDGGQQTFKEGASVFGVGRLHIVSATKVRILRQGTPLELSIENAGAVTEPNQVATLPKEKIFERNAIKKFMDNPREIFTDARMLPNISKGGVQEGFVLREVKPNGFYDTIGLANGDVIMRVNSMMMNSADDGVKIFNVMKELDRLELDIVRNGTKSTITYHIK